MTIFLGLLLAVVAPKAELRIHVFTKSHPSGFVDADQQRRLDTVKDLRGVLDKDTKRFQPVLVESSDQAQITIEVLSSAREDLGDREHVFGSESVNRKRIIRARVIVGEYATEIMSPPKVYTWRMAAAHWQREFRKWLDANNARLLADVAP